MKHLKQILFFLIILSVQIIAQSQEDYFNNALDAYLDGKYDKALENLNMVTSPDFDVSSLRSQILEKLGRSGEVVDNTGSQPQESGDQNVGSSSDDEIYFEAVELFQNGEYAKAKELLLKINSDEIDTAPLLEQIADLEGSGTITHSADSSPSNGGSDEEKYFKALELYQAGSNQEALDILKTISTQEIDTKPLIDQITLLLRKPELKPAEGEKVDITPFEYKIRKKVKPNENQKSNSGKNHETINVPISNNTSSLDTVILVIVLILVVAIIAFVVMYLMKKKYKSSLEISLINKTTGAKYKFNKNLISIGRDDTCDITLDDEEASRRHAEIVYDENTKSFFITDLKSTNGVIINGKKSGKTRLYPGDNIKIGNQLISVNLN